MDLFWLDIESTGLDPQNDHILEVAIARAKLEDPFNIGPILSVTLHLEPTWLSKLAPVVAEMHGKSGLIEDCMKSWEMPGDVERHLLAHVPVVEDYGERPTLAGSSVHFDHSFLRVHMPTLAGRFSHRHYDVSAIKLFCRSLGMTNIPKANAHRAKADILESISHAVHCERWLREGRFANVQIGDGNVQVIRR